MSKKHRQVCTNWKYIEHFLILASPVTGCISISAFASVLGIPIGITSSSIELSIFTIPVGVKMYKQIIKKKKKKHGKMILIAKGYIA